MIQLVQFTPLFPGIQNASPFCLKLETYLKMAQIPYRTVYENDPRKGPKKKLPFIIKNGKKMGDSGLIIKYLEGKNKKKLDKNLTKEQKTQAQSLERLMDEHLYWVMLYYRWADDAGYPILKKELIKLMPKFIGPVVIPSIRKKLTKQIDSHGMGRHSKKEIFEMGKTDLTTLFEFLGKKSFFMGKEPTTIDACAYAFLANILWDPFPTPVKKHLKSLKNLPQFCKRMKKKYYS